MFNPNEPTSLPNLGRTINLDFLRRVLSGLSGIGDGPPPPVPVPSTPTGELPKISKPPVDRTGVEMSTLTGEPVKTPFRAPSAAPRGGAPGGQRPPAAGAEKGTPQSSANVEAPPPIGDMDIGEAPGSLSRTPGPRWRQGVDPNELGPYTHGEGPDFSQRWSELQRAVLNKGPWWQQALSGLSAGFNPQGHALLQGAQNQKIEMAERALQREQAQADMDFKEKEDFRQREYLMSKAPTIGKSYMTDAETGVSGWFSPAEAVATQGQQEMLELRKKQLELEASQLMLQGRVYEAQAKKLEADALYTSTARGQIAGDSLASRAAGSVLNFYTNQPMLTMSGEMPPALSQALETQQRAMGGVPPAAAPAAPALGPIAMKGKEMGLPDELLARIDEAAAAPQWRKAAILENVKKSKWSQFTPQFGQLIGVGAP